jgi:hypothetical protein
MQLVNLCPHEIDLLLEDGSEVVLAPCAKPARAAMERTLDRVVRLDLDGGPIEVPLSTVEMGEVTELPPPAEGTWYIVSLVVAYAHPERADLLVPDDLVRDEVGRVIACQALSVLRQRR